MKAKTRAEKEVVRLSNRYSRITERQKRWMTSHCDSNKAIRYHNRKANVMHFIIVTTCKGWQVLRHAYCYAYYKRDVLKDYDCHIVMEEWLKDGEYVFLSRDRFVMSGYNDSWCLGHPLQVRRGALGGYTTCDPRELGYEDILFARVHNRFNFLPLDIVVNEPYNTMFRAVNAHPYNETLLKQNLKLFKWSKRNGFLFDKEKTNAIKIAIRHHFAIDDIWKDMIDALAYLGKDLHNPYYVCGDLAAHDKWCAAAEKKRQKRKDRLDYLRRIKMERQELLMLQQKQRQEEESKALIPLYKKAREKYFGLRFCDEKIEISVLRSVEEFLEEGKELSHCVFSNAYYDINKHPHSLILSAKVNGKRCETIEVDLKEYKIIQCRGKHNQSSEYHEKIVQLIAQNMRSIAAK